MYRLLQKPLVRQMALWPERAKHNGQWQASDSTGVNIDRTGSFLQLLSLVREIIQDLVTQGEN